jgi:hypothetical protein
VSARCAVCGHPFRAKRRDARFCSARCRQRASRAGKAGHVTDNPANGAAAPVTGPEPAPVWTREADAALEAWANRKPTTMGDLSLAEANRMVEDAPAPTPRLPWWRRPERRPRSRYCDMAIERGEPASGPYHAECAAFVAARAEHAA